jgi:hypothetical protein
MRVAVGRGVARHHRDVRLRLGGVVERDRKLGVDLPVVAERAPKGIQHPPDRRRVPSALRLRHQQEPVDELQALAGLEHSQVDQALVL